MKRSEINGYLAQAIAFCDQFHFKLPPWAYWGPEQWQNVGREANEVRQRMLGWDITDFGFNRFEDIGLLLFTIRNGRLTGEKRLFVKDYAEKMLLVKPGQVTPVHFHWSKMEDIINRGGGKLVLNLWNTEAVDRSSRVHVSVDGFERSVPAGGEVTLEPGESITLTPFCYHSFKGKLGCGMVLCGEVSRVNNDKKDNNFVDRIPRFPPINEDEAPQHLLCWEYPKAKAKAKAK